MLDGERFYSEDYSEDDKVTFYFAGSIFRYIDKYSKVRSFNPCDILIVNSLQVEITPTIQDAIAEKPRLCWVWYAETENPKNMLVLIESCNMFLEQPFHGCKAAYKHAELATLEEIKQFLGD